MKIEIQKKLEELAFSRTSPFCYGCYMKAPKGVCPQCRSDDLMRLLEGVGVEWGTSWVIKHILKEELAPVNLEEAFEESVRQSYPEEVTVGWAKFDTVEILKTQDPVSWRCALIEYEAQEESEGSIMSFDNGNTYYWTYEIEKLLDQS